MKCPNCGADLTQENAVRVYTKTPNWYGRITSKQLLYGVKHAGVIVNSCACAACLTDLEGVEFFGQYL